MHSFSGGNLWCMGAEAIEVFSTVASRLVVRTNSTKSRALATLYGRLNMILVRANAGAIVIGDLTCHHLRLMTLFYNSNISVIAVV